MWLNLDDENTSHAAEFITDWSCLSWYCGIAAKVALPYSRCDSTKDTDNNWRTDTWHNWHILLSWCSMTKKADTVFVTFVLIDRSTSMKTPRSHTATVGMIWSMHTHSSSLEVWWSRRSLLTRPSQSSLDLLMWVHVHIVDELGHRQSELQCCMWMTVYWWQWRPCLLTAADSKKSTGMEYDIGAVDDADDPVRTYRTKYHSETQ